MATIILIIFLFLLLLIFIPFGVFLYRMNPTFGVVCSIILGVTSILACHKMIAAIWENYSFEWYHLVMNFILIGMMNNGNLQKPTHPVVKEVTTYLFASEVITAIFLFSLS